MSIKKAKDFESIASLIFVCVFHGKMILGYDGKRDAVKRFLVF